MDKKEYKLTCKLTSQELRQRKATVIATLKELLVEKKEIHNGYRYRFNGSDQTLDLLNDFIKTERLCCDFFIFTITSSTPASPVWLELQALKAQRNLSKMRLNFKFSGSIRCIMPNLSAD